MCGSKPKKAKATKTETMQAEIGAEDLQRFQETFLPIEMDAIADTTDEIRDKESGIMRARANADIETEASMARGGDRINLRNGVNSFSDAAGNTENQISLTNTAATQKAEGLAHTRQTGKILDTTKSGRGMARSVHSGMSTAADAEVMEQRGKLRASAIKNQSIYKAFDTLAGGAVNAASMRQMRNSSGNAGDDGAPRFGQKPRDITNQRYEANFGAGFNSNRRAGLS